MAEPIRQTLVTRNKSTLVVRPEVKTVLVTSGGPAGPGGPQGDPGTVDPQQIADAINNAVPGAVADAVAAYFLENPIPEAPNVPQEVVVADDEPPEYEIWVQTGLGDDGNGFTIWFKED